ncbi:MAG: hypothetical protein KC444_05055 [Nitrosopumilus sp.]|nr:hypothetical protein [Nitrosopumilus sp.]
MDYNQLCKDVMDLDSSIRFSMVVIDGVRRFGGYRYDVVGALDSDELTQSISYAFDRMIGRFLAEEKLGRTKYAMAEYEKVKRVTFPLDQKTLLLVSMDVKSRHNKIITLILKLIIKHAKRKK